MTQRKAIFLYLFTDEDVSELKNLLKIKVLYVYGGRIQVESLQEIK